MIRFAVNLLVLEWAYPPLRRALTMIFVSITILTTLCSYRSDIRIHILVRKIAFRAKPIYKLK